MFSKKTTNKSVQTYSSHRIKLCPDQTEKKQFSPRPATVGAWGSSTTPMPMTQWRQPRGALPQSSSDTQPGYD